MSIIDRNRAYLKRCLRNTKADMEEARRSVRAAELNLDQFELRNRPVLPTPEIKAGIREALTVIKRGDAPGTHQGKALGAGVTVHGQWAYVWVEHGAPYGRASNGYLWKFTESEIAIMREEILSSGATIETDWSYEKGHTFVIARKVARSRVG